MNLTDGGRLCCCFTAFLLGTTSSFKKAYIFKAPKQRNYKSQLLKSSNSWIDIVTSGFLKSSNESQLQMQRKTQSHKKEEKDFRLKDLTYYLCKDATLEMVKQFKIKGNFLSFI